MHAGGCTRTAHYDKTAPKDLAPNEGYKLEKNLFQKTLSFNISCQARRSNAPSPAWTVMGSWGHSYKKLIRTLESARFTNLFIFILLLSSADYVNSKRKRSCDIDKCGDHYRSISDDDDSAKKCRQLSLHRDCLRRMETACRGNLLYHTSVHINEKNLGESNCLELLSEIDSDSTEEYQNKIPTRTNQCIYAGKPKFKFCSLFGDPHVRTFSDKFYTCKANGQSRLISNDYLVVRATNSPLPGKMEATAISKLVVIIRGSGECAKKKTYRAEIGANLPASFDDGTTHTGPDKSVNITLKDAGKEVQIDIRFIATTIVVRNVGSHLTFSIQMPEDIVDNPVDPIDHTTQMCVSGCPRRQRIRLAHEIGRLTGKPEKEIEIKRNYTEQEARRRCRDALLGEDDIDVFERQRRRASRGSKRRRERRIDPDMDASAATFKQLSGIANSGKARAFSRAGKTRNRHRSSSDRKSKKWDQDFLQDDPGIGRYSSSRSGRRDRVSSVDRGTNFYFEACVFDLMTTGDVTYATSARGAFDDVTRFHRSGRKAKGASKNVIANWTPATTTTSTPAVTEKSPKIVAWTRSHQASPTTSAARAISFNMYLLLFCLFSTAYFSNLIQVGFIFEKFSNRHRVTT